MSNQINDLITALNNLGCTFCNYAGDVFVQSGALIVLLLFVDFLIRRRVRATLRYWIWMLVFVKLILPPSLSLPTGIGYWRGEILPAAQLTLVQASTVLEDEPAGPPVLGNTTLRAEEPQVQLSHINHEPAGSITTALSPLNSLTWQAVVFVLWLVGVAVFSALLIQRILYVRRLIADSEPAENSFSEMLNICREQVGVRRPIELRVSNSVSSPAVCGLFKLVILMPTVLMEKPSQDRLRAVLVHELCHIKRGDLWINSAQTILQIIYFYNPLVWLANTIVRRIRELAVDEMVLVTVGTGMKDYSNTLIDIAETAFLKTSLSLRLIGVVESKKALEGRIKHMANRPIPKSVKLGILGLMTVLILGAALLPMARAQKKSIEYAAVDIAIDNEDLRVTKLSEGLFEAVIILRNKGSVPIPQFRVNFHAGDPDKGGRLLSPQAAGPIQPGESWTEYNPGLRLEPGENTISVIVDPDNKVDESDETNNKVSQNVTMLVSESEKAVKVGAIQKVSLTGDDILQVESRRAKGFNFPFYLFIPRGIDKDKPVYMLVETNNSGTTSDDFELHRAKALRLVEGSYATRMAQQLDIPLLVPTFPRPRTNWWVYTHALDIDTLETEQGKLKRIDLQLTAMIKYAQELLRTNGFKINEKVFMHGFSASAKFCNRYSFLHPQMVKAVAAGGVNGLPTLPVRQWNGYELPFPIGIAGIEKYIDGPFNEEAFSKVAHYIYMGSLDRNDTLPSRDAWREDEAEIIKKALAEKMMPDRWELSQEIYSRQKVHAQLVTYSGVTHSIKKEMQDDVINFFKANSGEDYVRITPYEYPAVTAEERSPKYETGSAQIDITPAAFDIRFDEDRGVYNLRVDIPNKGSLTIPGFKLRFYRGDPGNNLDEAGNVHGGWHGAGPIEPGKVWGESTRPFYVRDGQYEFNVVLDFDNSISEIDENNNQATLKVRIENGQIADKSITCPSNPKDLKSDVKVGTDGGTAVPQKVSNLLPNIFIMSPTNINLFPEILVMVKDIVLNCTGRNHDKKFYDEIFIDEIHHKKPGDIIVLLFSLDSPDRIPKEYEDLLPKPWPEIEAALQQGQTVELKGQAREMNVVLLAAPTSERLRSLVQESKLLNLSARPIQTLVETSGFAATLSYGTTVELVGVCEWPEEGKRCWRPDGSQLPMGLYASKRNIKPIVGDYGFIYKVTGPDDIKLSCRISGASQTEGSCEVVDGSGNQRKDLIASISDMEKGRLSTTIRIGVAAGPWKTISNHEGKRMTSGREGGVLWSQAFQDNNWTHIIASRERQDQDGRIIAIDKDGQIHTTRYGGSVTSGELRQRTSSFRNLELDQIKEFQYQIRSFQWVEFKNVSLKPGNKTDVEF